VVAFSLMGQLFFFFSAVIPSAAQREKRDRAPGAGQGADHRFPIATATARLRKRMIPKAEQLVSWRRKKNKNKHRPWHPIPGHWRHSETIIRLEE
jgi:hypothetical protein